MLIASDSFGQNLVLGLFQLKLLAKPNEESSRLRLFQCTLCSSNKKNYLAVSLILPVTASMIIFLATKELGTGGWNKSRRNSIKLKSFTDI
jgi:hypothetical protein